MMFQAIYKLGISMLILFHLTLLVVKITLFENLAEYNSTFNIINDNLV